MCATLGRHLGVPVVTGVTPDAGPNGKRATVTVHGRGFLPISGADMVKVFLSLKKSYLLPARCKSATACTVTLPALRSRTVNVQVSAEDSSYSTDVKADRFTYRAARLAAS
jgi:hypothetical protein